MSKLDRCRRAAAIGHEVLVVLSVTYALLTLSIIAWDSFWIHQKIKEPFP